MEEEEAIPLINKAIQMLHEHFDAVQILVSWNEQCETRNIYRGSGNVYARFGMAHDFIKRDDAQTMADEIGEKLEPPAGDEPDWKSQ